jgi:N-acetylmuramate 1-kinase
MSTQKTGIPERVTNWVRSWLSIPAGTAGPKIELLAGDGSPRQFFRVQTGRESYVVLFDPTWALSKDYAAHQQFLAAARLPVPAFPKEDPAQGFLAMEDLGDELLQFRIRAQPQRRMAWLEEATKLLGDLHLKTFPVPARLPVATRRFDAQKYGEEMAFTFEHLHEKFLGLAPVSEDQKKRVAAFCRDIETVGPEVFAHRDYHCRNILVRQTDAALFLIDFQDARLGPPHYDLASLIYDAYVEISGEERKHLIALYRDRIRGSALDRKVNWESFGPDLEAVAFQRVVKAAGSFASFFNRYGKDTHLPYLLPALTSASNLAERATGRLKPFVEAFPLAEWKRAVEKRK